MNFYSDKCSDDMIPVEAAVRQRIGCPANCGGKIVKKIVGFKCTNCQTFRKC